VLLTHDPVMGVKPIDVKNGTTTDQQSLGGATVLI
jgi:hypothetical protein